MLCPSAMQNAPAAGPRTFLTQDLAMLIDLLQRRRAVRHFDFLQPLNPETVRDCLRQATLAPSAANLQLYEFHHISNAELLKALVPICLNQQPAATAAQLVVFVCRQDKAREHCRAVLRRAEDNLSSHSSPAKLEERLAKQRRLYQRWLPLVYARGGLLGLLRSLGAALVGLRRPVWREVSAADVRIGVHRSCALAAQTFMLAMAEAGYDTCPLEGYDSRRLRRALRLPRGAEISLVVACGIRHPQRGLHGERSRLPFGEVYRRWE